jgi:hypothetical protein
MKARELGRHRLMSLQVVASRCASPHAVVATLGALQAQDYAGALWAIGLRCPGAGLADVERAVGERSIVRTWPLRGTLHFVAADDVYWLLDLLAARVIKASEKRRLALALDDQTLRKVERLLVAALSGGKQLTRDDIGQLLAREKIGADGGRLYHLLFRLSLSQLLCFGTPVGKQPTFTLLSEAVPKARRLERDAALGALATRYFVGHGPARSQDLMRWGGLTAGEVKLGLAAADGLVSESVDGTAYWMAREQVAESSEARGTFLLPGFDEFILGYGDRSAILDPEHAAKIVPGGNGVFRPTVVHDGKVVGTWRAVATKKTVRVVEAAFAPAPATRRAPFARAALRYAKFLGREVVIA